MEDEINLSQLFATLWRGKFWIALIGLIFLGVGGWFAFSVATPIYTASATVALDSREQNVMDIESVVTGLSGDQSTVNTEVEVIRSRTLLERLVLDLNLVEDPEFNVRLREPPVISTKIVSDYIKEQISGPLPDEPTPSDRAILDAVIDELSTVIAVTNIRNSYVFKISVVTENPTKSEAISNRLAELYINDQVQVKFEKTEQATTWLSERVAELQASLEASEDSLKSFSSNTNLVSPEGLIALNRQLKNLRERRNNLEVSLNAQIKKLQQLETAAQTSAYEIFGQLADDYNFSLTLQRETLSNEDRTRAMQTQAKRILVEVRLDIERNKKQLTAVESSISEVNQRIDTQSDELVKLQQLQRETEANRLIYEAFLSRLKETSIQQGIQQADSRILSRAVVPTEATAPRKSRILLVSLLFGLTLGSGIVLLREMSQNTFRNAEELEKKTQVSVLGQIPSIPARKRANVLKYLREKPNSGAAEAIRNLRTSVMLANVDKDPQLIMSTSSIPGEGKTTQSIALAQNFAGLGEKVLLIEGDIRRRVFQQYFNIKSDKGFLRVLSGEMSLEDVICKSELIKADILMGESSSVNAADLFASDKFAKMLEDARAKYDRVIIDTPPVLAVPDARVIGQKVDSIVYTVKWDSTSQRQVIDGLKSLNSVNLKVSGLVLGQINKRGMQRYGYGDTYGSYQGYYDD